jgi:hypothetical protein
VTILKGGYWVDLPGHDSWLLPLAGDKEVARKEELQLPDGWMDKCPTDTKTETDRQIKRQKER